MKTWQKFAASLIGGVALLTVIGIAVLISVLPDPAALGRQLKPKRNLAQVQAVTSPPSSAPSAISGAAVVPAQRAGYSNLDRIRVTNPTERKRLVTEKFLERFLSDDRIESRVCENLQESPAPFKGGEDFGKQIESSLLGETKPSATVEAVMLPIEYTLKNEAIRELIRSAKNAAERGDTGFLNKAQFYSQAARATASVLNSREELESISGNAYRLYAIARATAFKPEILQDPDLGDLCRGLERAAVDGATRDEAFDRERLARLLQRHSIDPASIGYDPEMSISLRVVAGPNGLKVETPWIQKVLSQ